MRPITETTLGARKTSRRRLFAAGAGAVLAPLLSRSVLGAPDTQPGEEMAPPPRPVSMLLTGKPNVTVDVDGDYGPLRVAGVLDSAPAELMSVTDSRGKRRELGWQEIRSLSLVRTAAEGLPIGSFEAILTADRPEVHGGGIPGYDNGVGSRRGWTLLRLPAGQIVVRAAGVGAISFPTSRLLSLSVDPLQGEIEQLPRGLIRLEPFAGTALTVPVQDVEYLHRDLRSGTISLVLGDGQVYRGKLLELPRVSISLAGDKKMPPIPLEQVVWLDLSGPSGLRALGRPQTAGH